MGPSAQYFRMSFSQMFHFIDKPGLKLDESDFFHLPEDRIPELTSHALVTCIFECLLF